MTDYTMPFTIAQQNRSVLAGNIITFDPLSTTSLQSWHDAADTTTITNASGAVSLWSDKTTNTNDANQSTLGNQPQSGARSVNGLNALDLDGANDFLTLDSSLNNIAQGQSTVMIAFQTDDANKKQRLISGGAFGGTKWGLLREGNGDISGFSNSSFTPINVAGAQDTAPHIATLRCNGGVVFVSVDGGEEIAGVGASSILDTVKIATNPNGNGEFFDGLIMDCWIFDAYLDDRSLNQNLNDISRKTGVTISTIQTKITSLAGQSNAARRFSNAKDDFTLSHTNGNHQYVDGASSGIALLNANNAANHWYNGDTNTIQGTAWNNYLSSVDGLTIDNVIWDHGESDYIGLFFNTYDAGFRAIAADIHNRTGADIYVTIPFGTGNNGSNAWDGTTQDESAQGIREIYFNAINDVSYIKKGAERFDLPKSGVHLTNAAYADLAARDAYILGGGSAGPEVTSVTRSGTTVTVTITHGDGTDFTPLSGIEGFVFMDGGSEIAINNAVRAHATTITLTLATAPTGDEILYYIFGNQKGITSEANLVIDNSSAVTGLSKGMPLRSMKWVL